MNEKFPIIQAGHVFNKFHKNIPNDLRLKYNYLEIKYPCRLDAMAINPAAVAYNSEMVFTPGEVVVSVEKYIKVTAKVINEHGNGIIISDKTKRKVLVKHAYYLMCKALNIDPILEISVEDTDIPKHCGFGSSSSTIAGVCVAINELYGNPIESKDLIKYLAANHAEEVSDDDENNLKVVQCIGGGATNGQTDEGIIIISGKACTISKMNYDGDILIGIPNDFVEQDADVLMTLEENNLWKFKQTGEKYKDVIAYDFLHKILPDMTEGKIESLAKMVFEYRFNMGSIENCSFVFPKMNDIANQIRKLYEENFCKFLALSSVGPAFFVITNNEDDKKYCIKEFEKMNLKVIESKICNHKYIVDNAKEVNSFWKDEETNNLFYNKQPSKYITDEIDRILSTDEVKNGIDIGCGGGRYSKYLSNKGIDVTAIDKNIEMYRKCKDENINNIEFKTEKMDRLDENSESFDLALSIGVIHNSENYEEYENAFKEIYRVLKKGKYAIVSVFTDDVITEDLTKCDDKGLYSVKNRPDMILLSKDDIKSIITNIGFNITKIIDEHITDVGDGGRRNVWTILLQK